MNQLLRGDEQVVEGDDLWVEIVVGLGHGAHSGDWTNFTHSMAIFTRENWSNLA
ncbi:MAG: hypothetical protein H6650_15085 [Ardenticatenales bacterium]|nr:hypothetical protein [Ardenticatenales bacterium]